MKPIVTFNVPVNRETVSELIVQLRSYNGPDTVLIDSPGGTFDFFSVRAPAIARLGITTVAHRVYSAATLLYILGAERIAHPDSEFLFHEVRVVDASGHHITVSDIEEYESRLNFMKKQPTEVFYEWQRQINAAQEWFIRFVARRTRCSVDFIRQLMRSDTIVTGLEAYRYGIATRYGEIIIREP